MDKRNETVMETRRREYAAAGVKPLEWRLYPIESISDGSRLGYLSKLFVNSLKLGVIAPETYEPSTAATLRGAKLAMWQLEETRRLFTRLAEEGRELPLVVISMSLKMFLGKTAKRAFSDFLSELSATEAGKICFAFTGEVLFMDAGDLNLKLEEAREKGLKTALVGYGEEYCPPLRLKGLKFDYIFLRPNFRARWKGGKRTPVRWPALPMRWVLSRWRSCLRAGNISRPRVFLCPRTTIPRTILWEERVFPPKVFSGRIAHEQFP
ncbi:MAG: EAL domain-containing protein [Christensenellaceae bacterium]